MIRQNPSERPDSIDAIKRELIGRRITFVERQELSRLKQRVIPTTEVDDPIVADPIRIVGVGWDGGVLSLKLNQVPHPQWVQAIKFGAYGRSSLMGKGPEAFDFRGDTASVSVRSQDAQRMIDYFKTWLPSAHEIYVNHRKQETAKRNRELREAFEREVRAREERESVNARLQI
jgi:hypothetical protein